jgi:hypothetical protein
VSSKYTAREVSMRQWIAAAGVIAASWAGAGTAAADILVDLRYSRARTARWTS